MNTEKLKSFLLIIKSIINEDLKTLNTIDNIDWNYVLSTAKKHNLIGVLAYAFSNSYFKNITDKKINLMLQKISVTSIMVNENQIYESNYIKQIFENNGIDNMHIKGIQTKYRYKQPILRTMGDIDILCKPEQQSLVRKAMSSIGYNDINEERKHDIYKKSQNLSVEIHRALISSNSEYYDYCSGVWQRAVLENGCKHCYKMTLEDEFIFNIIHLVDHFKSGGIGIKFILDIYIYDLLEELDIEYVYAELEKLNLLDFYKNLSLLSKVWFSKQTPTVSNKQKPVIDMLSEYILKNGVFGNLENQNAALITRDGRFGFLIKSIFPPYKEMCSMFTWLTGKPYLLLFAWCLRIFRGFKNRRAHVKKQFNTFINADSNIGKNLKDFYIKCGLKNNEP